MTGMWIDIGAVDDIPLRGARTVKASNDEEIAIFRTGEGRIFALENRCPHRHGHLSQGIVHGNAVTCPLHNWVISLETGEALGPDKGCTPRLDVKVEDGRVLLAQAMKAAA